MGWGGGWGQGGGNELEGAAAAARWAWRWEARCPSAQGLHISSYCAVGGWGGVVGGSHVLIVQQPHVSSTSTAWGCAWQMGMALTSLVQSIARKISSWPPPSMIHRLCQSPDLPFFST